MVGFSTSICVRAHCSVLYNVLPPHRCVHSGQHEAVALVWASSFASDIVAGCMLHTLFFPCASPRTAAVTKHLRVFCVNNSLTRAHSKDERIFSGNVTEEHNENMMNNRYATTRQISLDLFHPLLRMRNPPNDPSDLAKYRVIAQSSRIIYRSSASLQNNRLRSSDRSPGSATYSRQYSSFGPETFALHRLPPKHL